MKKDRFITPGTPMSNIFLNFMVTAVLLAFSIAMALEPFLALAQASGAIPDIGMAMTPAGFYCDLAIMAIGIAIFRPLAYGCLANLHEILDRTIAHGAAMPAAASVAEAPIADAPRSE